MFFEHNPTDEQKKIYERLASNKKGIMSLVAQRLVERKTDLIITTDHPNLRSKIITEALEFDKSGKKFTPPPSEHKKEIDSLRRFLKAYSESKATIDNKRKARLVNRWVSKVNNMPIVDKHLYEAGAIIINAMVEESIVIGAPASDPSRK